MLIDTILPVIMILSLFVLPYILHVCTKQFGNPVPSWIPALAMIIAFIVFGIIPKGMNLLINGIAIVMLLVVLALAVYIPFTLFERMMSLKNIPAILSLGVCAEIFCAIVEILAQDGVRPGFPWTEASIRLPFLIGQVMDSVLRFINADVVAYEYTSKVYFPMMTAGLCLETILIVGLLYAGLCLMFPAEDAKQ